MTDKHFTYILRCSDGTLYTGYTIDMEKRVNRHNLGKGARFTRGRGPVEVVYYEEFSSKNEAMVRESEIKRLNRQKKLRMICGDAE